MEDFEAQLVAEALAAAQANATQEVRLIDRDTTHAGVVQSTHIAGCAVLPVVFDQSKRRRASEPERGADAAGAAGSSSISFGVPAVSSAGVLFLVRLVGPLFSFYSMDPSTAFLQVFEDYSQLGDAEEPPLTSVHKCQFTFSNEGAWAGKTDKERTFTEFNFQNPHQRRVIVSMLEWIRLRIVQ